MDLHRPAAHPSGNSGGEPRHGASLRRERASRDSIAWEEVRARLEDPQGEEERDAVQYLFDSPMTQSQSDFASYGAVSFPPGRPILAGAMELMNRIHKDFRYDTTVTDVVHAGGQGV